MGYYFSFTAVIVQYYADIVNKKLTKGARDIVYSRTRLGFVSRKREVPPAEAFLDLEELKVLPLTIFFQQIEINFLLPPP
jgi:hypothetical protein